MIQEAFGVQKLFRTLHSQETVAIGATVMAAIQGGLFDLNRHFLVDQELVMAPVMSSPEEEQDLQTQIEQEKKF